jgi:PAS domain S-box-containing protein
MFWTLIVVSVLAMMFFAAATRRAFRERALRIELEAARERERKQVQESEQLMRAFVDSVPVAIILFSDTGKIIFTNESARDLFFEGQPLEGQNFLSMLKHAPEPLARAITGSRDELFSVETEGEVETYGLSKRHFDLGGELHTILVVKQMTHEISRKEVDTWKKVIRVIAHELTNSLAPISSLMHSARLIVADAPVAGKLHRVFDTVAERVHYLQTFLEGYVRLARLPPPKKQKVSWAEFLASVREMFAAVKFEFADNSFAFFDSAQMQQVLLNLLKNAEESGCEQGQIEVIIEASEDGTARLTVRDSGKGMSDEVLKSAFLPFYSTKEHGSGLGLPLCREIVESHNGRIRIKNRPSGGVDVVIRLPGFGLAGTGLQNRLTLTRE